MFLYFLSVFRHIFSLFFWTCKNQKDLCMMTFCCDMRLSCLWMTSRTMEEKMCSSSPSRLWMLWMWETKRTLTYMHGWQTMCFASHSWICMRLNYLFIYLFHETKEQTKIMMKNESLFMVVNDADLSTVLSLNLSRENLSDYISIFVYI